MSGCAVKDAPACTGFMDPAMLRLWRRMKALPGGLRLYGGTALALYLNHRQSTDFDFATPEAVVDLEFIGRIEWLGGAVLTGGPGMVDGVVEGGGRAVMLTFMECGQLVPMPQYPPMAASNGIAVAHPVDLVAAKIEACVNRGASRDYGDVAAAFEAWPEWTRTAVGSLSERTPMEVARAFSDAPSGEPDGLGQAVRTSLRRLASEVAGGLAEDGLPEGRWP